jgi:hypothetical protein
MASRLTTVEDSTLEDSLPGLPIVWIEKVRSGLIKKNRTNHVTRVELPGLYAIASMAMDLMLREPFKHPA